jgi:hypothetical protein
VNGEVCSKTLFDRADIVRDVRLRRLPGLIPDCRFIVGLGPGRAKPCAYTRTDYPDSTIVLIN